MSLVYLIGFRGVGKTTLGRRLAREEGWDFLDLDEEWERRHRISILEQVEKGGLESFRQGEYELLREIEAAAGRARPLIVATGGGILEGERSLELLEASPWPKILLEAPVEELWARLENHPERRKIGGLRDLAALTRLWEKRLPNYYKIATARVLSRDITQALTELKQWLRATVT